VEDGRPKNHNCRVCGVEKTEENTYKDSFGHCKSYCKSCEKQRVLQWKRDNGKVGQARTRDHGYYKWKKIHKNQLVDPEWAWYIMENGGDIVEEIDVKYKLKDHGNKGKKWYRKK